MKKLIFISLISIVSSNAFARSFICENLKDSNNENLSAAPSYSVDVSGPPIGEVTLLITSSSPQDGGLVTTEVPMTLSNQQSSAGAIYYADNIETIISAAPAMPGLPSLFVVIQESLGSVIYTAKCQ